MASIGSADLHIHTSASDGVATVLEVLDHVQVQQTLDVIAITDHDRLDASCWAYEHQHLYSFDIIPGVEITTAHGHVLGLWVLEPIPPRMSFAETVQAIHEQGGVAILAHPCHFYVDRIRHIILNYLRNPQSLADVGFDAIEVHNAGILFPGLNLLARYLANQAGLPGVGNSDAHTLGAIGRSVTHFPGKTSESLRQAILRHQTSVEGKAWPLIDYWNYLRHSTHNESNEFLVKKSI
jgi:predicted metal-dependent phosphoesterase TrpH